MFTRIQLAIGLMLCDLHAGLDEVRRDEEGQALVEYGLILALIAVLCIVALTALSGGISGELTKITGYLK